MSFYKSFTKNDGDLYLKYFLSICSFIIFSSFLISFKKFSRNFNEDILRLVFACFAYVGSAATFGVSSAVTSSVVSRVGILSRFFIGDNLLLKLRTFSLTLKSNPNLL